MNLHMHKKMSRVRVTWTISPEADNILARAAEQASRSYGRKIGKSTIINDLILQKLRDPVEVLKQQQRELAKQINDIANQIKDLQDSDTPKPPLDAEDSSIGEPQHVIA
jgi:hypothetical protein